MLSTCPYRATTVRTVSGTTTRAAPGWHSLSRSVGWIVGWFVIVWLISWLGSCRLVGFQFGFSVGMDGQMLVGSNLAFSERAGASLWLSFELTEYWYLRHFDKWTPNEIQHFIKECLVKAYHIKQDLAEAQLQDTANAGGDIIFISIRIYHPMPFILLVIFFAHFFHFIQRLTLGRKLITCLIIWSLFLIAGWALRKLQEFAPAALLGEQVFLSNLGEIWPIWWVFQLVDFVARWRFYSA